MKTLIINQIRFIPVLVMVLALASLTGCNKDDDDTPASDSLAVTVYFNGNKVPVAGDILSVVVYNSNVTQIDLQVENGDPDVMVSLELTQDMIDDGVTVNLDTINLDAPQMYIGAYVNMDDVDEPSTGDLVEFYEDVDFVDAFYEGMLPVNAHGLSSVEIYLDQVLTYPTLNVTVNFSGNTTPSAEDVLHVALFYYSLDGLTLEQIDPDDEVFRNLTPNDITTGTVTMTLHNIYPWEDEVYIGVFVDADGDESPGPGELMEMYEDKDINEVLAGTAAAANVADETAITVDLDLTLPI